MAYSDDPDIVPEQLVSLGKTRFLRGMEELQESDNVSNVSPWLRQKSEVAKQFFHRNLNGIGKTSIILEDNAHKNVLVFVERSARASLEFIERADAAEDKSHSEFGVIDAYVARTDTYHGKPAIYIKDRLTGKKVSCVLTDELAAKEGPTHSWSDAWTGKRVRIKGQIYYNRHGKISRVSAVGLEDVSAKEVT